MHYHYDDVCWIIAISFNCFCNTMAWHPRMLVSLNQPDSYVSAWFQGWKKSVIHFHFYHVLVPCSPSYSIVEGVYNSKLFAILSISFKQKVTLLFLYVRYIPVRYAGGLRHRPDYTSLRSGCLLSVQFTFPISKIAGSLVISILF